MGGKLTLATAWKRHVILHRVGLDGCQKQASGTEKANRRPGVSPLPQVENCSDDAINTGGKRRYHPSQHLGLQPIRQTVVRGRGVSAIGGKRTLHLIRRLLTTAAVPLLAVGASKRVDPLLLDFQGGAPPRLPSSGQSATNTRKLDSLVE